MTLSRRTMLTRLAAGAGAAAATAAVVSSPAFADGGSPVCRPQVTCPSVITIGNDLVVSNRVRHIVRLNGTTVGAGSFPSVSCPCGPPNTSTQQFRYSFDAASPSNLTIVSTFGTTSLQQWLPTLDPTPVVRGPAAAMPSPSSWTIRFSVRWRCTDFQGRPAWTCCSWIASCSYSSPPATATIGATTASAPGPVCDLDL